MLQLALMVGCKSLPWLFWPFALLFFAAIIYLFNKAQSSLGFKQITLLCLALAIGLEIERDLLGIFFFPWMLKDAGSNPAE